MNLVHYVYQITNLKNGKIYIGVRSHCDPDNDLYFGSSNILKNVIRIDGVEIFDKKILHKFSTREEARNKENEYLTQEFCNSDQTYNISNISYFDSSFTDRNHSNFRKDIWYDYYDDIRLKYMNGWTIKELCKFYECWRGTIQNIVQDLKRSKSENLSLYWKYRQKSWRKSDLDEHIENIIELYKQGHSCLSISNQFNVKETLVRQRLIENNIEIKRNRKQINRTMNKKYLLEFLDEITSLYNSGIGLTELGKKYDVAGSTIKRLLSDNSVIIRTRTEQKYFNFKI